MNETMMPTIMNVGDSTFGSVRAMVWAHKKRNGKYRFFVRTVKLIPVCSAYSGWSNRFSPEDVEDLRRAAEFVEGWFRDSEFFRIWADQDQLESIFHSGLADANSEPL